MLRSCWRAPLHRLSTLSNMAAAPSASTPIAGRFRYPASTTIPVAHRSARRTRGQRSVPSKSNPRSRPRPIQRTDPKTVTQTAPAAAPAPAPAEQAAAPCRPGVSSRPPAATAPTVDRGRCARPIPRPLPPASTQASPDIAPPPAKPAPAPAAVAPRPLRHQHLHLHLPPFRTANSPLGVWLTEEKEGKVRIEQCGANLCGYSVDTKSNQNGEQVLINMKPGKDQMERPYLRSEQRQHL